MTSLIGMSNVQLLNEYMNLEIIGTELYYQIMKENEYLYICMSLCAVFSL